MLSATVGRAVDVTGSRETTLLKSGGVASSEEMPISAGNFSPVAVRMQEVDTKAGYDKQAGLKKVSDPSFPEKIVSFDPVPHFCTFERKTSKLQRTVPRKTSIGQDVSQNEVKPLATILISN